jgi:hypothetical protein
MAAAGTSVAQQDISGTWVGMLPAGPGTTLEVHFVLTRAPDGGYSAVLKSPTPNAIPETPATSTSFTENRLVLAVDALSGRYEGTFANGRITGNWHQQGTAIPLDLEPYAERELSTEAKDALRGSWVGELAVPQANVTLAVVLRFENNAEGAFVGFFDSPDQGATGIPISTIEYDDGAVKLVVPQIFGEYTATLAGDAMDGTFLQLGQNMPLALKRGEYVARGQEMSAEAIDRLEGSWVGRVTNAAGGALAIVFRFEESAGGGGLLAYLDSPEQGARNVPMTEVMLDDSRLSLVIPAAQASFTGTVASDEIAGTWAQGNRTQPVTMTRGEYVPSVTVLDIPAEAFERLAGTWRGPMGPLEIVVRFERTPAGAPVGFLDVPTQNVRGLAVAQAAIDGDQVTIGIPAPGVTLAGTLSGTQIVAEWRQGQAVNPVTLTRDP